MEKEGFLEVITKYNIIHNFQKTGIRALGWRLTILHMKTDGIMQRSQLSMRLNKIIVIVAIFTLLTTVFSHWLSLRDKKNEYLGQLESTTAFLVQKIPEGSFASVVEKQGAAGRSADEQVLALNREFQPILADVLIMAKAVKFGIYSRNHERIVAIGPDFDSSLLVTIDGRLFAEIYETDIPRMGESKASIVWYGATVLYHIRPISSNGQIIGHAFASMNLDDIYTEFWKTIMRDFLGAFAVLLIIIMMFQEGFIRLRKDLGIFAEGIISGRSKNFESEIPELTPVLKYISEQTENMARLDRLNVIGEMAASIGHEVRNPMTTVRGFLQFLSAKEEFIGRKDHFMLMIEELDRANGIISEFLSLAKNKAMDYKHINLNKVINEVAPLLQADALRHNCQIELKLGDVPKVRVDENSIRQLILNMVRNAIEAMPEGGTVTIGTVSFESKVLLSIEDQGVGISPEIIDKLGTPFVTTKENGIGLGLAVCHRIVQRHGATIVVESKLGRGTKFIMGFNWTNHA